MVIILFVGRPYGWIGTLVFMHGKNLSLKTRLSTHPETSDTSRFLLSERVS